MSLLDAGCGTGGLLAYLQAAGLGASAHGLEYNRQAADLAISKTGLTVDVGTVNAMPYPAARWDVIVSADVLCHGGVDEAAALSEFRRCLRPGGWLVMNLPAYQWMLSGHDRAVHNVRRYTAGGIRAQLKTAGFAEIRAGYWNSLLFPLMLLHRLTSGQAQGESDVKPFSPTLDRLLFWVTGCELWLASKGIRLPFGGSVWVVAQKQVAGAGKQDE